MMTFILFVVIFGVVVIAHEFGHFLLAKLNGIHVIEFAVGMGPTLFSVTKGETKYSVKLFPIGGACMFEGEDGQNVKENLYAEGSFSAAGVWSRIGTVVAGPLFNFVFAFVIAFAMVNMSDEFAIREPIVSQVTEDGAAAQAGIQAGDRILKLDGERVRLYQEIPLYMQTSYQPGDAIAVECERDGDRYTLMVEPKLDEETGTYLLGIMNADFVEPKGLSVIPHTWYQIRYSVKATYKSLGMMLRGDVSKDDVAGPVGIAVNVVGKTYEAAKDYGWKSVLVSMLNITLMLTVNLGIINLLPLPALDGGRLIFMIVELLRGKPVPPEKEGMVHFIGLIFFMALMVLILFNDIRNILPF